MPELPEVETIRRHLAPLVEGRRLIDVEVRHPRTARRMVSRRELVARLAGGTVEHLDRRGKFLLASLRNGMTWVTHLGMSGHIEVARLDDPEQPHTHFVAVTDRGDRFRLVDPRTFGFVAVFTPDELAGELRLGRDALVDLPAASSLVAIMSGRTASIKALLLDQRIVAGLGNIYSDEILHRARLRPSRAAGSLAPAEVSKLRAAIRPVLEAGIEAGGTSLGDLAYLLPDGRAGRYLDHLRVYGREGAACRRCGGPIERTVLAGRSSYFCPRCQT
ncbi:MAG: bifunctional DNA-formamidopyrimidine glycosylase/DNA-(apurinic or apyrimidinic site) lyase [Actinomycetota bacterium]